MADSTQKPAKFAAVRVMAPTADGVIEIDLSNGCVRIWLACGLTDLRNGFDGLADRAAEVD